MFPIPLFHHNIFIFPLSSIRSPIPYREGKLAKSSKKLIMEVELSGITFNALQFRDTGENFNPNLYSISLFYYVRQLIV
ncbi:hypothetical protein HanRHA438_Chr15g0705311 [Helianthus annuus]|nr:hypothetical protein HanRHA438_Chr15g0705311 [Helianthus annuus]